MNNPSTNIDLDGNRCASVNPKSDALPLGCGAPPVQARDEFPPAPPQPAPKTDGEGAPAKPKSKGPDRQTSTTPRHPPEQYIPGSARARVLTWTFHSDVLGNLKFSPPWNGKVQFEIFNDGGGAIKVTLRAYMGQGGPHTSAYNLFPQTSFNTGPIETWGILCPPAAPCEYFEWSAEGTPFENHDGWPLPSLTTFPFLVRVWKWDFV